MTEWQGLSAGTEPATWERGKCRAADGLELSWQSWTAAEPAAVVAVVHGLAEHGGRYREAAEYLAAHGMAVYAIDLRAHGLSPDVPGAGRVHVDRFDDYFRDVDALISLAGSRHPDRPVFLLGHSMGGLISLRYLLDRPAALAGAVISSPALGTHPDFKPPWLLRALVGVLSKLAPRMRFPSDLDTAAISRDPDVVQAYVDDPLVSNRVSTRWYAEILKAITRAHERAADLRIPVLLMQSGADRLVDPQAPARWAAASPDGLVELVTWKGLYHEMFNEPEKQQVLDRTIGWLRRQLDPSAPA